MEVYLSVEGAVNEEIKSGWRTAYEGIRTEEDHERVRSQHDHERVSESQQRDSRGRSH
jgi:hypothetical protein